VTQSKSETSHKSEQCPVEVEADDDLLDLDLDPTAEAEELIKALNSDDYDPPADVVAPAPKPPDPPAAPKPPDPPKDDSDSRMTFEAYRRMCAFAADDEEDLFTRAISGAGSATTLCATDGRRNKTTRRCLGASQVSQSKMGGRDEQCLAEGWWVMLDAPPCAGFICSQGTHRRAN
jgi:hypothetical protein